MKDKKASRLKSSEIIVPVVLKKINISVNALFYIFSFCLLAFYRDDFLYRLQELSIFLPTNHFFAEFMTKPAGLLFYFSSFLLQFFYYSVIGAFMFTSLLALVQFLVYKSFPFIRNFLLVSLLPSALILLCLTQLDHIMYIMPDKEIVYTYPLGVSFILLFFLLFRNIKSFFVKILYVLLITSVFYPFAGFYSLIAALLIAGYEIITSTKAKQPFIFLTVSALTVFFIPLLYYYCVYDVMNRTYIYFYGLPVRNFTEGLSRWIPVIILPISLFVLLVFCRIKKSNEITGKTLHLNILTWIVCLCMVVAFTKKDKILDIQLKMERALGKNDFNTILKIANETKYIVPNRTIIQYRNIALSRTGQLLDKMFTYPHGLVNYQSPLVTCTAMSAHSIYYYYGRLNFSYRWAMEHITKRGISAEHLKYMTKVATFNGETELAEKYFAALKQTLFYRNWAEENVVFLYNHNLFEQQDDYKYIYPLTTFNEGLWENSNNVEANNLTYFCNLQSDTPETFEHSFAAALIKKDISSFMAKFHLFVKINGDNSIPVHLQEAAMLFIDLENKEVGIFEILSPIKFDQRIVNRYSDFHNLVRTIGMDMNKKNKEKFHSRFGNTYWYYYFFNENLVIN